MKYSLLVSIFLTLSVFVGAPSVSLGEPSAAITTTKSGLRYTDATVGSGATATRGKKVAVHYTGWILESGDAKGKKFDSSLDHGDPFEFSLGAGEVIPGWDEGVQGMKIGGKRTLMIPSQLAYGPNGIPGVIPPSANLIFDVELLAIR